MTLTFATFTERVEDLFGRLHTMPRKPRKQRMELAMNLGDILKQMIDEYPAESAAWLNRNEGFEQ